MDWLKLARAAGFDDCGRLNTDSLRVLPEVRNMCAADAAGCARKAVQLLSGRKIC